MSVAVDFEVEPPVSLPLFPLLDALPADGEVAPENAGPAPAVAALPSAGVGLSRSLRRDLRSSLGDGTSFSIMVGAGETYLPAFVLALGMGDVAAGLVATIPMLLGALLQLAAPYAIRRLGSRRAWVVGCAAAQGASLLALPVLALAMNAGIVAVYAAVTLYWAAGLATGPAWNTWMEDIVPSRVRARFFAVRVRLTQIGTLAGFLLGGVALQALAGGPQHYLLAAFAGLFALAAACRFVSAWFLSRQSEPTVHAHEFQVLRPAEIVARLRANSTGRVLLYLLSVQVAVYVAAPYFTPYMLSHLHLSYLQYVSLIAVAFAAKILAMPILGRLAQRVGARKLLWWGGWGIIPMSGLWLVNQSVPFLMFVQIAGGFVWACYELGMMLLFFEAIPKHERTSLMTVYNLANALAMVLGGLVGAALLSILGHGPGTYLLLFALSSVARAAALGLLARLPDSRHRNAVIPMSRTATMRPNSGAMARPLLAAMDNER